jgi:hypothetical protein
MMYFHSILDAFIGHRDVHCDATFTLSSEIGINISHRAASLISVSSGYN